MLRKPNAYKLNVAALQDLRTCIPAEVLQALTPLQDTEFRSRRDLAAALPVTIGHSAAERYAHDILRKARILTPRRAWRYVHSVWQLNVASSRLTLPLSSYVRLRPLVFTLYFRMRWLRFAVTRWAGAGATLSEQVNTNRAGFIHNRNQVSSFQEGHRNRTERLINILRTIEGLDSSSARVLCVGPRNEAELLLLNLYGFPLRNILAIDLFSYSPTIELMDMNDVRMPDDSFDIYYSSAVIKYSPDIRRTIAEAVRVTRSNGLMVFGFMFVRSKEANELIPEGADLAGGVPELLDLFGDHVGHVFWQQEFPFTPEETRASVIFQLKK